MGNPWARTWCVSEFHISYIYKQNRFYKFFWFSALTRWDPFWMRFWYQLGSIFPPQILQNPHKIWSQEGSDSSSILASNFYRFWLRFGNQVGAMWANFFEPRRPKRPPRRPKRPPRNPKTPLKTRLVARIRPDPQQASMFIDFWSIFGRFSIDFY